MAVNRVQVIWTSTTIAGGGLSTFYFESEQGTAAQQVAAVATFLGATEDRRTTGTSWVTASDVATLNEGTGALEGITSVTQSSGVGTVAGEAMPPASQGLLRLLTGQIVSGRLLRGRLFLPAGVEADSSGGAPTSTYRNDYDAAAAALIADANTVWTVWSQTHGVESAVLTANTWNKWAVLRSRRD